MDTNVIDSITGKGELRFTEMTRLLFFGIPWPFTKFLIYENDLVRKNGLLNIREDDCLMYKISDVQIRRGLMQRLFGLSTLRCLTSDVTDKEITLKNIKNGPAIKDFLVEQSERARLLRRTVNMQNIGFDHDGNPDAEDML